MRGDLFYSLVRPTFVHWANEINHANQIGETKMNVTTYIIHALIASILALGPLAIALYLDLNQKREATQKSR